MPHLHLAYSANLPIRPAAVLAQLNRALLDSGLFEEGDIKSRAQAHTDYLTGCADTHSAYAHVTVWLLSGRSEAARAALAQSVLAALDEAIAGVDRPLQLTVDIQEMARSLYANATR